MSNRKHGRLFAVAIGALVLGAAAAMNWNTELRGQGPFADASPLELHKIAERVGIVREVDERDPIAPTIAPVMVRDSLTGHLAPGQGMRIADGFGAGYSCYVNNCCIWQACASTEVVMRAVIFGNANMNPMKPDQGIASDPTRIGALY